jgi:general secretion pathway protein G
MTGVSAAFLVSFQFARLRQPQQDWAKGRAEHDLERLRLGIGLFEIDIGRYPTTSEGLGALIVRPPGLVGWNGPYLKGALGVDPWNRPYLYITKPRRGYMGFDLTSLGADGKIGTSDDIILTDK